MIKKLDLVGKRFHRLLVICQAGIDRHGKSKWLCKCDCGNEVISVGHNLISGNTQSCGCFNKEQITKANFHDITGNKYDRLEVLEIDDKRDKFNHIYWKCKCDCGNITIVSGTALKMHITKSCGCLGTERRSGKNNKHFGKSASHGKGFWYLKTDNIFVWLRSTYELRVAKKLDENNIIWEYEKRVDLDGSTYAPDFYLPEYDMYIETKGYLYINAYKKLIKFNEMYPDILLKIFEKKDIKLYELGQPIEKTGTVLKEYLCRVNNYMTNIIELNNKYL